MVRKTGRILNHQDHADNLVIGRYMANGGKTDGVVTSIRRYPDGSVLVTLKKESRSDGSSYKHLIIQGDLECEVL